jgi:hypothetical protein
MVDVAYWVCGRYHRKYYHNLVSAFAIAQNCYPNDENAKDAAFFHIELDNLCSSYPLFRQRLEFWADKESEKRKHRRKRKKKRKSLPPEIKRVIETKKKLAQIQKLTRLILS